MSSNQSQFSAMTVAQKLKIANNIYVSYPRFKEILSAIEYCHHFSCCKDEPECMFLFGSTGVGKTTIYRTYASKYPRETTPQGTTMPILAVTIPAPATVKTVVSKLLWQLGDPAYDKGSTGKQTIRLIGLMKDCGVQLLILDEFQHFIDRDSAKVLKTVSDWLKTLILDTNLPIVLIGLPEAEQILKLDCHSQLSRRFANRFHLAPFVWQADGGTEFRTFLHLLESQLPLESASYLSELEMARRFYYASDGVAQCQCGFDFRDCQATAATEAQVNFSFYLHGSFGQVQYLNAVKAIYQPDNPVFQLTLTQFSRLSSFLGSYVRVYWRHQRCIALAKIVFTEFDSELEELFKVELVFDFFKEWENHMSKLLQWHEKNLQQRTSQLKTVSSMVDFLVKFSNYFPVRSSIAVWLESYLIEFLSRYGFDQIEIIWTHPVHTHSRSFKLKEVQCWLPKIAQTWNELELNLARLILASQDIRYLSLSELNPTSLMILRNPEPQILKLQVDLCFS